MKPDPQTLTHNQRVRRQSAIHEAALAFWGAWFGASIGTIA
jgi:hypothetical protein